MTKKTLTILPPEARPEAPVLKKKGRGWNIADSRLDTLHAAAREMRRTPSPAQVALGDGLTAANLGKYRLKRNVVIGSAIVDFACQPLRLVVLIEEDGENPEIARRRDRSLAEVGLKVLRFPARDVLGDAGAVTEAIVAALKGQWAEARARPRATGAGYRR